VANITAVPALGNPGNWEEMEHAFAALQQWLAGLNSNFQALQGSNALTPVGSIVAFASTTAPSGWLLCDGSNVSRTTYAALFLVLGTSYGVGDGSTTFGLPDLRGRFPLGKAAAGTGSTLAATGGAIDHTHTAGAITTSGSTGSTSPGTDSQGAHTHTVNSHTHGVGPLGQSASWSNVVAAGVAGGVTAVDGNKAQTFDTGATAATSPGTDSQGAHTHTVNSHTHGIGTIAASGAATGTNNPPFQTVSYVIFTGL
jgi:microcystin-dependent protein